MRKHQFGFLFFSTLGAVALLSAHAACAVRTGRSRRRQLLGEFGDWGAYTATPGGKKVCFALAKPAASETDPAGSAARSGLAVRLHPSVGKGAGRSVGDFRLSAEGQYRCHDRDRFSTNFAMYTQNDGAWVKNAAEEARLVDAHAQGRRRHGARRIRPRHQDDRQVLAKGRGPGARPRRHGMPVIFVIPGRRAAADPESRAASRGIRFPGFRVRDFVAPGMTPAEIRQIRRARLYTGHDRRHRHAPLEKTALEVYVAPDKPSLIGASRAQLADMLGGIGVAERERKMRAQQIWHWLYVRGAQRFRRRCPASRRRCAARWSSISRWSGRKS